MSEKKSIGQKILAEMGWKEKTAAWVLFRWLKQGGVEMMSRILGNWQTSASGVYVGVLTALQTMGYIDAGQFSSLLGLGVTIGLLVSKDAATGSAPGGK